MKKFEGFLGKEYSKMLKKYERDLKTEKIDFPPPSYDEFCFFYLKELKKDIGD